MIINQVSAVAGAIEAARLAGSQQAATAAAATGVQRQVNKTAAEADLRKTEIVPESDETAAAGQTTQHRLDITV